MTKQKAIRFTTGSDTPEFVDLVKTKQSTLPRKPAPVAGAAGAKAPESKPDPASPAKRALKSEELSEEWILEQADLILASRLKTDFANPQMAGPSATRKWLRVHMAGFKSEVFGALFLDNQHRLIESKEMFYGTIDGASVHPRVVVAEALKLNAAAMIIYHNHPSGVAEPSQADRRITDRLKSALGLIDVRILDHMVVGDSEVLSFAERGLL